MGIFQTLKGSILRSPKSDLAKFRAHPRLYGYLLPARMKKIQSQMKALEYTQHYTLIFRCSMAANSVVGDGILLKFKLVQADMIALVTSKSEEDPFKYEGTRVVTPFLPL